ncbi:ABC transporter substrate-binding protein [Microbacterium sp. NPDC090218]
MTQQFQAHKFKRFALVAIAGIAVAGVVGCASVDASDDSIQGFSPVEQDSDSTVTVWVDAARLASAEAYQAANPDTNLDIVTYDTADLQTKISLADKSGSGWPDVVFSQSLTDVGWATSGKTPFAAPLNDGIFPDDKIEGFATGALDPCTVGGTLYCVRNDIAQNVFWYNETLMGEFGYDLPTTWEDFAALGEKLSTEHPGYVLGSVGDQFAPNVYFWGAGCPAATLDGVKFSSDLTAPECTEMAALLDGMVANGSLVIDGLFSAEYATTYGAKTLGFVGPSWAGKIVWGDMLGTAAGNVAAAEPFSWEGKDAVTGNVGGGVWYISSHSANLEGASALVEWLTTSEENQASAGTYPAYTAAAMAWLENPANTEFFASDVGPAFKTAADQVWSGWSAISRADPNVPWGSTVVPGLVAGKTISEQLPEWETEILNLAPTVGYTVEK